MSSGSKPPAAPQSPVTSQQLGQAWGGATGNIDQAASNPYPMQTFQQFYPGMQSMYGYNPNQTVQQGNYWSSQAPAMFQAGQSALQAGMDPRQDLYNRTKQQVQDAARVSQASRGIQTTPYGAGLENQAMSDFNIDWQNQQLQRLLQGIQGGTSAYGAGGQALLGGEGMSASVPQNMANYVGGLQQLGMGAYGPQMYGGSAYGNLFSTGTSAQNQAYQNQLAQWQAKQQQRQSTWGGIGNLVGSAATLAFL